MPIILAYVLRAGNETRIVRERHKKGSTSGESVRECKVFRLLVWSMRDACSRCCIATTHPLGSKSYCNGEFDSNSEINAEHPLFLGAWHPLFPASDMQTD